MFLLYEKSLNKLFRRKRIEVQIFKCRQQSYLLSNFVLNSDIVYGILLAK